MTEATQASEAQIAQLQKHGLHDTPWTLSSKEAWGILHEFYEKDVKTPVVKPGFTPKVEEKKPSREFHLSPEQVNTNALNAAIEMHKTNPELYRDVLYAAQKFKEFIENGN